MRRMIAIMSLLLTLAGCAAAPPAPPAVPAVAYPVFFQQWSAAIDANAATTIATAAQAAQANPALPVIVTGSADTVGSEAANKDLALTRAQVVADALVADGVTQSRIALVSSGAISAPGAPPGTPAQFSRRVLIRLGN
jgi:outer membrane protein OmpA-like peptidoglycan-associated protein